MINLTYVRALAKLVNALDLRGIDYSVETHFNGFVVRFSDGRDVAIHDNTYGHATGLWESYGFPEDKGDVTGYLTADEVCSRFYVSFDSDIWWS